MAKALCGITIPSASTLIGKRLASTSRQTRATTQLPEPFTPVTLKIALGDVKDQPRESRKAPAAPFCEQACPNGPRRGQVCFYHPGHAAEALSAVKQSLGLPMH